ncbi:hypothetical protein T08_8256 [Trichinella sp. T8]|nr:hypothetical protein T08_8256 [Trichinella sp. T8]
MATSRLFGNYTAPALHKSPTTYLFPSNVTDSLNFLLTSSSGLVSTSCTTPIESISQNLLNSKLSSSVAPAELLSVTVETMVVLFACRTSRLRTAKDPPEDGLHGNRIIFSCYSQPSA